MNSLKLFYLNFTLLIFVLFSNQAISQGRKYWKSEYEKIKKENKDLVADHKKEVADLKDQIDELNRTANDNNSNSQADRSDYCDLVRLGDQFWETANLTQNEISSLKSIFECKHATDANKWNSYCKARKPAFAVVNFESSGHIILNYWAMIEYRAIAKKEGLAIPSVDDWNQLGAFLKTVPKNESGEHSAQMIKKVKEWSVKGKGTASDIFGMGFNKTKWKADDSDIWYDASCIWLESSETNVISAGCLQSDSGELILKEREFNEDESYFGFPIRLIKKNK